MRVRTVQSKNDETHYAVIKDIRKNGRLSSVIVEHLGSASELQAHYPDKKPHDVAKQRAKQLTDNYKRQTKTLITMNEPPKIIENASIKHIGYLFLDQTFYRLGYDKLIKSLVLNYKKRAIAVDVTRTLIATLLLAPMSLKRAHETVQTFLEAPTFPVQSVYRTLDILVNCADNLDIPKRIDPEKPYFQKPPYLTNPTHIKGYQVIATLALNVLYGLRRELNVSEILPTLRTMYWFEMDDSYRPYYMRTPLTDKLHDNAGFRTDFERITYRQVKKILRIMKTQ